MLVGTGILIYMLDLSLASPESFASLQESMTSPIVKFIVWGVWSFLAYHTVAGVKHLIMDAGFGETLEGGVMGAKLTFAVSIALILLGGLWIW